jgi:hypothetical protein
MPREHPGIFPPRDSEAESQNEAISGEDRVFEKEANDLIRRAQEQGHDLVSRPDAFGEPSIYSHDGAYLANRVRKGTKRPPIVFVPLGSPESIAILTGEVRKGTSYQAIKSGNEKSRIVWSSTQSRLNRGVQCFPRSHKMGGLLFGQL